jgi:hypothetical protein
MNKIVFINKIYAKPVQKIYGIIFLATLERIYYEKNK